MGIVYSVGKCRPAAVGLLLCFVEASFTGDSHDCKCTTGIVTK